MTGTGVSQCAMIGLYTAGVIVQLSLKKRICVKTTIEGMRPIDWIRSSTTSCHQMRSLLPVGVAGRLADQDWRQRSQHGSETKGETYHRLGEKHFTNAPPYSPIMQSLQFNHVNMELMHLLSIHCNFQPVLIWQAGNEDDTRMTDSNTVKDACHIIHARPNLWLDNYSNKVFWSHSLCRLNPMYLDGQSLTEKLMNGTNMLNVRCTANYAHACMILSYLAGCLNASCRLLGLVIMHNVRNWTLKCTGVSC